ncbi:MULTISPECIES: hypothetical protein [Streptomyces]|uniref:hypothetical protein n=1 Tax=Streptomyces TaxID=1883 RepID=UPI0021562333|nr:MULTISPECIES: hypothetical protein [Streptomyces]MCY0952779.1 hypothetical protein [Streptomyces sp. H27-S2]
MPDATALDQATTMIEKAWGRPIEALESLAVRRPSDEPLLRSAMRIRSSLVVTDNAVAVHQDRLHALTQDHRLSGRPSRRSSREPDFPSGHQSRDRST